MPDITEEITAKQIDWFQMQKADFLDSTLTSKKAGFLFITVPVNFYVITPNKPSELLLNPLCDVLNTSIKVCTRVALNSKQSTASCRIQVNCRTATGNTFNTTEVVDSIMGRRREIHQDHGILIGPSNIRKYHFRQVLALWLAKKLIFKHEPGA